MGISCRTGRRDRDHCDCWCVRRSQRHCVQPVDRLGDCGCRAAGRAWRPPGGAGQACQDGRLVVLGGPGAGKTVLVTELMIRKVLHIMFGELAVESRTSLVKRLISNILVSQDLDVLCPFPAVRTSHDPGFPLTWVAGD
jgi:hypothetical protein